MTGRFPALAVAFLLSLTAPSAGCGGLETVAYSTPDGGARRAASPPTGEENDVAEEPLAPPTGDGLIFVHPREGVPDVVDVSARFRTTTPPDGPLGLAGYGKCRFVGPSDDATFATYVADASAGQLTVRAGSRSVPMKLADLDEAGPVYGSSGLTKIAPGTPLVFEATGDAVPAFSIRLEVAHPLELAMPVAEEIAKDAAFDVVWKPTTVKERLAIDLYGKDSHVVCVTDTSLGVFAIPVEYVRAVADDPRQDDDGNPALALALTTTAFATVRAGNYEIKALSSHYSSATLPLK